MKLQAILSRRALLPKRRFNTWRSWQLVYEWEDVFGKELKLLTIPYFDDKLYNILGRCYHVFPLHLLFKKFSFVFEMLPKRGLKSHLNNKNVIPCIIDWYLKTEEELSSFFKRYSNHKMIIVTSMQAYKYLCSIKTPIPFRHLPLSLSDKYKITPNTKFDKDVDVVLMGRQNPVLLGWLEQYKKENPELIVVSSKRETDNYDYYTSEGSFVANAVGREQCINLMKRSRVSLYSTKAMDDDYTDFNTNGFNQVTPRLLECIATGNHVIARYKDNEDTDYYEINSICPHTDSYDSFKKQMDYALSHPVDMKFYSEYLEKHYTSTRVKMLEELMNTLE